MYNIVAIFGRSGSGKDTLLNDIFAYLRKNNMDKNFNRIVRYTTRPKRQGEKEGNPYFFVDNNTMIKEIMNGNIVEAAAFGPQGWVYGTNILTLEEDKINIGVYDIEAIQNLIEDPDIDVFPIFVDTNCKNCLIRAIMREKDPDLDEIIRRYQTEKEMYDENLIEDLCWRYFDNNEDEPDITDDEYGDYIYEREEKIKKLVYDIFSSSKNFIALNF